MVTILASNDLQGSSRQTPLIQTSPSPSMIPSEATSSFSYSADVITRAISGVMIRS